MLKPLPRPLHRLIAHASYSLPPCRTFSIASPSPLHGTRALITGASRGIGASIARALASQGAQCLLIGRHSETLAATLATLPHPNQHASTEPEEPSPHAYKVGDVSKRAFWDELDFSSALPLPRSWSAHEGVDFHAALAGGKSFLEVLDDSSSSGGTDSTSTSTSSSDAKTGSEDAKARKQAGERIDILVNAAGITHASLLVRSSPGLLEEVVQTNLMGTMWACRAVGKKMMRAKAGVGGNRAVSRGVMINVASLLALNGGAGSAAYSASKAGVVALTRSLAAELGPAGIRVNAILPGYVATDMVDAMTTRAREEALSKVPLGRFGTAEEIAEAAVFLACNGYANNCVLNLDGGLSAV